MSANESGVSAHPSAIKNTSSVQPREQVCCAESFVEALCNAPNDRNVHLVRELRRDAEPAAIMNHLPGDLSPAAIVRARQMSRARSSQHQAAGKLK